MALPWMESLPAFADTTSAGAFPKRFGVLFMGNGVNEDHWDASGNGAEMRLSKTLAPLEPLKHKINVIHGLFHKRATGQGIHPAQTGSLLSGATIDDVAAALRSAVSEHPELGTLDRTNVVTRRLASDELIDLMLAWLGDAEAAG